MQLDTATMGELDAMAIRNNAAREAFGYRVQGIDYRRRADAARLEGRVGAFNTILTSGIESYGMYYGYKDKKKGGP